MVSLRRCAGCLERSASWRAAARMIRKVSVNTCGIQNQGIRNVYLGFVFHRCARALLRIQNIENKPVVQPYALNEVHPVSAHEGAGQILTSTCDGVAGFCRDSVRAERRAEAGHAVSRRLKRVHLSSGGGATIALRCGVQRRRCSARRRGGTSCSSPHCRRSARGCRNSSRIDQRLCGSTDSDACIRGKTALQERSGVPDTLLPRQQALLRTFAQQQN